MNKCKYIAASEVPNVEKKRYMKKCELLFSLNQLVLNVVTTLMIIAEPRFQEIRKEKQAKNKEKNEEFDKDDYPELPTYGHAPETIVIEQEDFLD